MDITEIIGQLKDKFGDSLDMTKVTQLIGGMDGGKLDIAEIIEKVKESGLLGDLDGDGKVESPIEELKGKAGQMFGSIFGK